MKFVRYGPAGAERPGVLDDEGQIRDLGQSFADLAGPALAGLGVILWRNRKRLNIETFKHLNIKNK